MTAGRRHTGRGSDPGAGRPAAESVAGRPAAVVGRSIAETGGTAEAAETGKAHKTKK